MPKIDRRVGRVEKRPREVVSIVRESFERGGRHVFLKQTRALVPKNAVKAAETESFRVYHYGGHTYLVPKAGKTLRFE